jgi:hypothetical protein
MERSRGMGVHHHHEWRKRPMGRNVTLSVGALIVIIIIVALVF